MLELKDALNEMEKQLGTINLQILKKKLLKLNGVKGKKVSVEYKKINETTQIIEDYKLTMLFFADKKVMQQVYVSSFKERRFSRKLVNRIIKFSIHKTISMFQKF